MKNKYSVLVSASLMVMLAAGLIVGGTYALFSDSVKVSNHLKAGNLNISLLRTSYSKTTLDDDGYLTTVTDSTVTDFTDATDKNIFDIQDDEVIVPCSSFTANMKLVNGKLNGSEYIASSTAFQYDVKLDIDEESNEELLSQMMVTINKGSELVVNKKLSEFTDDTIFSDTMTKNDAYQEFSVKLDFSDLTSAENNLAQDQKANFDLIIEAIQLTSK